MTDNTAQTDTLIITTRARIAVYDDMLAAPRVVDVEPAPVVEFIETIATKTYELSHAQGGSLPYMVIREIAENFIHAHFTECTVSILDGGNTLRFSDQGPGIEKKSLVLQPGISSATTSMKRFIKGVGSGFPVVREYLGHSHGFLSIEDNAAAGTVITLVLGDTAQNTTVLHQQNQPTHSTQKGFYKEAILHSALSEFNTPQRENVTSLTYKNPLSTTTTAVQKNEDSLYKDTEHKLSPREEQTLLLLLEQGMLGPSELSIPLKVSTPTATRVLQKLELAGMVEVAQFKKRILSNVGLAHAQRLARN
jgi:hypothetical protein